MQNKEEFLQLILNNIPSYVFWKDRQSIYLGCNMNFALSAGLNSPEEIIGKSDYDLAWSKTESDFFRLIDKKVMDSGESKINFEEPQTINDGSERWLRTSKIPLYSATRDVIGILGTYEDITERKLIELELVESNKNLKQLNSKLEMINIDLEQFAYATSHDLQEPLRTVGAFSGLINKRYSSLLDDKGIEYLKFIEEGTQRMSTLINQILIYSKLEKREKQFEEIDLTLLLQEILSDLSIIIKNNNAAIEINLPDQNIICQGQRMKMLFYNLITNAIKFNDSKNPRIKIDYKHIEEEWHFIISDNGIGIEDKYQDHIFKPFKRLNTRKEFPGNGIGLSICNRIVQLHNGQIWYTHNTPKGTNFHFTIPKNPMLDLAYGPQKLHA